MALPRVSTLHHFLGVARVSTTSTASSPLTPPPPPPSRPAKPYYVTKTPSNLYPVYTMKKRGGNMKLTKLRRIEGDVAALRRDLQEALGMEDKEVVINQLTRHIIVKGHKKPEIEAFLKDREL